MGKKKGGLVSIPFFCYNQKVCNDKKRRFSRQKAMMRLKSEADEN